MSDTAPAIGSLAAMGFDPNRKHQRSNFDYFYVGAAIVVCALLVVWAFFG